METINTADRESYRRMTTDEQRAHFLKSGLFEAGKLNVVYSDVDRAVVAAAVPTAVKLELTGGKEMSCAYFHERRESGVINLGAEGTVTVDGTAYLLAPCECLYIGKGAKSVTFGSVSTESPAQFYLVSYPAHAAYPTTHATAEQANLVELGSQKDANQRTIRQFIRPGKIQSCQLVMGYTELAEGSVWNTYPPHTHDRRTEVYCYFNLPENGRVIHLFGEPSETRHLVLKEKDVVFSPAWSIHSGVGTGAYRFVWAMGGENQVFEDMDPAKIR
jgi:4-deoxy-L-threo-5-hexosulose-uronate ketol-isomerase